jgi:quinol monooxygenase YgiN
VELDELEGIFYEDWLDRENLSRAKREEHVQKTVEELEWVHEEYMNHRAEMKSRIAGAA